MTDDTLTLADVRAILARITYKPNVRLHARAGGIFGLVIEMDVDTLDSRREYPTAVNWPSPVERAQRALPSRVKRREYDLGGSHLRQVVAVPDYALDDGEARFVDWLREHVIRRFELHEVDEWLRLDGEHVTDPHPEMPKPRPLALDIPELRRRRHSFPDYPLIPDLPPLLGPFA